jgi:hypothetical protein
LPHVGVAAKLHGVPSNPWFATDQELPATVEDLDRELHDEWLDFATLTRDGVSATISGHRERPVGGGWFRVGRYPVVLTFNGVAEIEMNDPDHLGGIAVCDVTTARGSMTLSSCFVGHLRVTGHQLAVTITLSGTPDATRRRFSRRWQSSTQS